MGLQFDPNNKVVQLCAQGMERESNLEEAGKLFLQAWKVATNDFEKFVAAHYVARVQKNIYDKLEWDKSALRFALNIKDGNMKGAYPSLYLNIAKCYEDLKDLDNARKHYELALLFTQFLSNDGYGKMIKSGIVSGIDRTKSINKLN